MPLIARLLCRRRRDADLTWREATRAGDPMRAEENVERVEWEVRRSQPQAYTEAVDRLLDLARRRAS